MLETAKKSGPRPQLETSYTSSGTPPQIRCSEPLFEFAIADVLLSASISSVVFFHHPVADHVIYRRFHKRRADHFAVSSPFSEIRDELLVIANVSLEFSERLGHFSGQV